MPGEEVLVIRNEDGRLRCFGGGDHRFPTPGEGSAIREVLTHHEPGHDAGTGHIDLRTAVIGRLAKVWRSDSQSLGRYLKNSYTGLPRGRATRPDERSLILHGKDAPVSDGLARVIRSFDLERRSVRVVFDERERMLPADRRLEA